MSTRRESRSSVVSTDALGARFDGATGVSLFRGLALSGILLLTASYITVLREITITVGGTRSLYLIALVMLAAATVLARTIRPRVALAVGVGIGALGYWYYLTATGHDLGALLSQFDSFLSDTVTLATGMTLYQMIEVNVWALGFVPAPVFLSWYLAMRKRYTLAVIPGGLALLFLVLTTDATTGVTLVGVVGGITAVGFGELDHRDGSVAQADVLAIMFAVIVFLSMTVTLVPGGAASPTVLVEDEPTTLDGAVDGDPDRSTISGSVDLSPEVHFTVVSDEPSYWRTGIYDRYTGDSWVRSGPEGAYDDTGLDSPPGEPQTNRQTITLQTDTNVLPVAPQPTAVDGELTDSLEVTDHGQPMPTERLIEGDTYNVESAIVDADPAELNEAGTDYDEDIEAYYLQTPEDLSEDFEARTADIVEEAGAETPYEKAAAIEQYFQSEYEYSLDVDRPDGNVANDFLLEMDEGYCVYFATAMTQMLRAEEVPARYVTGYTSGQQVDDNEHVVRGLDAHAWVEVYFPEHGWVAFEPTPSGERDAEHTDRLEDAREDGEDGIDIEESEDVPADGIDDERETIPNESEDLLDDLVDGNESTDNDSAQPGPGDEAGDEQELGPERGDGIGSDGLGDLDGDDPGDETDSDGESAAIPVAPGDILVGLAVFIGLAAGAHRSGVPALVGREVRRYWHGRRVDPVTDVERAFDRLEYVLARRHRPRRRGESPRQYLEAIDRFGSLDPRVERVIEIHERAHYGGDVDRAAADEAIDLVSEIAREQAPLVGRFFE